VDERKRDEDGRTPSDAVRRTARTRRAEETTANDRNSNENDIRVVGTTPRLEHRGFVALRELVYGLVGISLQ
jgi:hypothetical protein